MAQRPLFHGSQLSLTPAAKALAGRLGHNFSEPELLDRALTHSSMASTQKMGNQRLEFLGDRVLGLVIAEALYREDADAAEGILAPRLNALVRKETCAEVAASLDVAPAMRLGRSEMLSGGRRKMTLLGDAMEAIIAAIYLDAGFEVARAAVLRFWGSRISNAEEISSDPKSTLQEWAQARGLQPPKYVDVSRDGPDHNPTFVVSAQLSTGASAQASSTSKKTAQVLAARALLEILEA